MKMCKKNQKYCPALIVMLRTVVGLKTTAIQEIVGAKNLSCVTNVITRRGIQQEKPVYKTDVNMDAIEREYLAGASTYELGEKYGVYHSTISKWMKQRGHVRGKGYTTQKGTNRGHETRKRLAVKRCKEITLELTDGNIELVEYYNKEKGRYFCHVCGTEFYRCNKYNRTPQCPTCAAAEIAKRKDFRKLKAKQNAETRKTEHAKDKICVSCGCVFHSENKKQKYCSGTCSRREKRHRDVEAGKTLLTNSGNHRKRARIYGVAYEPGITVKKLIKRDNNICQICGEPCDSNDHRWSEHFGPLYPTIDHIIAMVNGGGHTWDNVQLAHAICNSTKRDLTEGELTEDVITHAKEQAIAHKCA